MTDPFVPAESCVSDPAPVRAIDGWETNGHLVADCARLGYLRPEWRTLDPRV